MVDKKEETKVSKYELVKVATQHELAIQNPDGDVMNIEQALVEVLNELRDIKVKLG